MSARVLVAQARECLESSSSGRAVASFLSYHGVEHTESLDEADVEVDGESMDADWDEPATDWMNAKKAAVRTVMACMSKQSGAPVLAAAASVDMVAAVRGGELLGAMDANRRGAGDVRFWGVKTGTPFDLYRLRDVPVRDAVPLNDFGSRTTRLSGARQAWALARKYAEPRPFKRVR